MGDMTGRVGWPSLIRSMAAVAVACGLAAGCGGGPPTEHDLNHLDGLLVANDGLYVVPDRAWNTNDDGRWAFRKTAALLVVVRNDRPDRLRFTLTPDGDTRRFHFRASWDGDAIWEVGRSAASQPLVVEMESERLTSGLHVLRFDRIKEVDGQGDREIGLNVFERVEVVRTDADTDRPVPCPLDPYLARFLEFGVTSMTANRLSGCLFRGPQHLEFVLAGDGGEASFLLENRSAGPATFEARLGGETVLEVELEAGQRRRAVFEVPGGRHVVTLAAHGLSGGSFLWGAPYLARRASVQRTPVVLVTLDTTRRDAVAPFAANPRLTPNIARLVDRASVYTNAYSTAPWTLPSHASIFTGLYPSHHRAGVTDDSLDGGWVTLAERFRGAGYRTAAFIGGHMTSSTFGMAQGFSMFLDPRGAEEPGDVITDAALRVIERESAVPLFLFLNYFDPHAPYSAPAEYQDLAEVNRLARAVEDLPVWGAFSRNEPGAWGRVSVNQAPQSDDGLAYLRARYDAEVAYMDSQIGRLFDGLEHAGLFDSALIVLAADHGEFMGERGLFSHSYRLDAELTAIPLIIKWPGQDSREVVTELVSLVDLYPTIARAAGLDLPDADGIGFERGSVSALAARQRVLMEEHKSRFHQLPGPFKIADHLFGLQWLTEREVFYPGAIECQSRIDDRWVSGQCESDWAQRVAELPAAMRATLEIASDDSAVDLDEAEAERLRALGYLQ